MSSRKEKGSSIVWALAGAVTALLVARCGSSENTLINVRQADRVGRPFINMYLTTTAVAANIFNQLSPAGDIGIPAAQARSEMEETLLSIAAYDCFYTPNLLTPANPKPVLTICPAFGAAIFSGGKLSPTFMAWAVNTLYPNFRANFLPDVLRIDTTPTSDPGGLHYGNGAEVCGTGVGFLCSGRALNDDAVQTTLSLLFTGTLNAIDDGTAFGSTIGGAFPYLDQPN